MQKVALLRVGADSSNLGFHSPLFKDGSYDYIPINETYNEKPKNKGKEIIETRTYGNTKSFKDRLLIDYFPENKKEKFKNRIIHFDPEFKTFTYGDPSFTKKKLGELMKDDYLLLYCSLTNQKNGETGLYLFAYFCVEIAMNIANTTQRKDVLKYFKNNFHVKHEHIFLRDVGHEKNKGLKLVKGDLNKSKVIKKPVLISKKSRYPDGKERYDVSTSMQTIFGNFNGRVCIQRNALRIISNKENVEKTIKWLETLDKLII